MPSFLSCLVLLHHTLHPLHTLRQNVTAVVPCTSLEPLVNTTMAGNTAAFVVDQSLTRAAAFNGPMPAEMGDDAQSFYYYYEDDADDTQVGCQTLVGNLEQTKT
jgi:hypothetical protein